MNLALESWCDGGPPDFSIHLLWFFFFDLHFAMVKYCSCDLFDLSVSKCLQQKKGARSGTDEGEREMKKSEEKRARIPKLGGIGLLS